VVADGGSEERVEEAGVKERSKERAVRSG